MDPLSSQSPLTPNSFAPTSQKSTSTPKQPPPPQQQQEQQQNNNKNKNNMMMMMMSPPPSTTQPGETPSKDDSTFGGFSPQLGTPSHVGTAATAGSFGLTPPSTSDAQTPVTQSPVTPNLNRERSEDSSAAVAFGILPRSVRWRIHLGILKTSPPDGSVPSSSPPTLDDLYEWNSDSIEQQKARWEELAEKYLHSPEEDANNVEEQQEGEEKDEKEEQSEPQLDPLTAMVMEEEARETKKQELYLKYRKERARRKRGLATESKTITSEEDDDAMDAASLSIIEKDLKRLPNPMDPSATPSDERIDALRQLLYLYAQEHPRIGYRQGMHEIASYLLLALEFEANQHPLFTPTLPLAFVLLENVLEQLRVAYDASGSNQSLDQMSRTILSKLYQNDHVLHKHLTSSPHIPPPPIYCTRWVRLLFSREVVGYENVLQLWDVFFRCLDDNFSLMHTMEMTTVCRILLQRDALLNPNNNPLDLLMNIPPITDITNLTDTLAKILRQSESDAPINLPHTSTFLPNTPDSVKQFYQNDDQQKPAFSLKNMRLSLGKSGETLRKRIINTTNEWKRDLSGGAPPEEFYHPNNNNINNNDNTPASATKAPSNNNNHHTMNAPPSATKSIISNPLMFPDPSSLLPQPKPRIPPRQTKLAQNLHKSIATLQEFLMNVEQQAATGAGGRRVPGVVWESLADLDRVRQELESKSVAD